MFPPKGGRGEGGCSTPLLSWSNPFFPGVHIKRQYTLNEMYNAQTNQQLKRCPNPPPFFLILGETLETCRLLFQHLCKTTGIDTCVVWHFVWSSLQQHEGGYHDSNSTVRGLCHRTTVGQFPLTTDAISFQGVDVSRGCCRNVEVLVSTDQ